MTPAHQCLDPDRQARAHVDDRLIVQLELFARYRLAQVPFQVMARLRFLDHAGVIEPEAVAALGLRFVERQIGLFHQVAGVEAVLAEGLQHHLFLGRVLGNVKS